MEHCLEEAEDYKQAGNTFYRQGEYSNACEFYDRVWELHLKAERANSTPADSSTMLGQARNKLRKVACQARLNSAQCDIQQAGLSLSIIKCSEALTHLEPIKQDCAELRAKAFYRRAKAEFFTQQTNLNFSANPSLEASKVLAGLQRAKVDIGLARKLLPDSDDFRVLTEQIKAFMSEKKALFAGCMFGDESNISRSLASTPESDAPYQTPTDIDAGYDHWVSERSKWLDMDKKTLEEIPADTDNEGACYEECKRRAEEAGREPISHSFDDTCYDSDQSYGSETEDDLPKEDDDVLMSLRQDRPPYFPLKHPRNLAMVIRSCHRVWHQRTRNVSAYK